MTRKQGTERLHFQGQPGEPTACGITRTGRLYISADLSLVTCRNCRYVRLMAEERSRLQPGDRVRVKTVSAGMTGLNPWSEIEPVASYRDAKFVEIKNGCPVVRFVDDGQLCVLNDRTCLLEA